MKKNKILIIGAVIVISVLLVLMNSLQRHNELKIGIIAPLSGAYGEIGAGVVNGAMIAVKELSVKENIKVRLIPMDGKADPKTTLNCWMKLSAIGIDGLIVAGDNQVPVVAGKIREAKMPTIGTVVSTAGFLREGHPFLFKNYVSIGIAARKMASFMKKKSDTAKVSVLALQGLYGEEGMSSFIKEAQGLGLSIVYSDVFPESNAEVKQLSAKVLNSSPDFVYIIGYGPSYTALINTLREQGFKGEVFSDEPVSSPNCKDNLKSLNSIWFTKPTLDDGKRQMDFTEQYHKEFGSMPNLTAYYGYDSLIILSVGLSEAVKKNRPISEILGNGVYSTCWGEITYNEDGDCNMPVSIYCFDVNGEPRLITK